MKAELLFQNRSTSPSLNAKREANSTVSNGFGIPVLVFPTILGKTSIICAIKDPHHFFFLEQPLPVSLIKYEIFHLSTILCL